MSKAQPASHSILRVEVEHLTPLISILAKRISPPKRNDPTVLVSISLVPNHDKKIKMTVDEMKPKIDAPSNQIEQMKKTNTERCVYFLDLCMCPHFEYLQYFRFLTSKNLMKLVAYGPIFTRTEMRCLDMS